VTLRRQRVWAVLLLALLAFVSAASFVHTDDGCQVEVHCLACRLALNTRVGTAEPAIEVWYLADAGRPAHDPEPAPAEGAAPSQPSRGPPLS
jgi:hypothetical protein